MTVTPEGSSQCSPSGSKYVRGYHRNCRYLVLRKNALDFLGFWIFRFFLFLYVIYYVSRLCFVLSMRIGILELQYLIVEFFCNFVDVDSLEKFSSKATLTIGQFCSEGSAKIWTLESIFHIIPFKNTVNLCENPFTFTDLLQGKLAVQHPAFDVIFQYISASIGLCFETFVRTRFLELKRF